MKTDAEKPELRKFIQLINQAGGKSVSDVHVHPDDGVWVQIHGELVHQKNDLLNFGQEEILDWLRASESIGGQGDDPLGDFGHTSVAYDTGQYRVRGSFRKGTSGVSCTFRLIPPDMPNARAMGVPQVIQDLMKRKSGLVLVEGATGSGKTTLNASLLDLYNETRGGHMYLMEDPIEFVHTPKKSLITQREIGVHAVDYKSAVENALRSAPHVILVGEMLNNATKKAALHAATTGHLVLTTAHAGSVAEAINSFIGGFEAAEQPQVREDLAQSLLAVIAQQLVPSTDGKRAAVRELMVSNPNFAEIIRSGDLKLIRGQMESSRGSFAMEDSLIDLVREERITPETAVNSAKDQTAIKDGLRRIGHIIP